MKSGNVHFTMEELVIIRRSIGSEIDIMEEELDEPKNQMDLSISRSKMLREQNTLIEILSKVDKILKQNPTYQRATQPNQKAS